MSTSKPSQFNVRSADGHVEVTGLSKNDVEFAIFLYQELGNERLRARKALASYVNRAVLSDGINIASTASQRQTRRSIVLREKLVQDQGALTYLSFCTLRKTQEGSARAWVSRARKQHELFTVGLHGKTLIPNVQLTDSGNINPLISDLVQPLLLAGLDAWSIWAWLTNPSGYLSGEIPALVSKTDAIRANKAAARYAAAILDA